MKKDSIVMLTLACLTVGAMLGHFLTPEKIVTFTITKEIPVEVIKEITKIEIEYVPYEVTKEIEVVKEIPTYPQWFNNEEDMADFLKRLENLRVTSISFNTHSNGACIYYAKQLSKTASRSGYLISVQSGRWTGHKLIEDHELCSTWIGKDKYFIEPQTLEYELVYNTDKGWIK